MGSGTAVGRVHQFEADLRAYGPVGRVDQIDVQDRAVREVDHERRGIPVDRVGVGGSTILRCSIRRYRSRSRSR